MSTTTTLKHQYPLDHPMKRLVFSRWFWLAFVLLSFAYPIYRSLNRRLPPELPRLYKVPAFELINQKGRPFGNKELQGKVYIANFMFTSCPTVCPNLMQKMQTVQKRVRGVNQALHLVTFTVDPEHDTPEVLRAYADQLQANSSIWHFLTGEKEELRSLLVSGFKVPMGESEPIDGYKVGSVGEEITLFDIAHTEKLVLVDHEGFVRGYYSIDQASLDKLMIDLGLLINREAFKR